MDASSWNPGTRGFGRPNPPVPLPSRLALVSDQEAVARQASLHVVHGGPQDCLHAIVGRLGGGEAALVHAVLDRVVQLRPGGRAQTSQRGPRVQWRDHAGAWRGEDTREEAGVWSPGNAVRGDTWTRSRRGALKPTRRKTPLHTHAPPPPPPHTRLHPTPLQRERESWRRRWRACPVSARAWSFSASMLPASSGGHKSTPLLPGGLRSLSMRTMSAEALATMRRV